MKEATLLTEVSAVSQKYDLLGKKTGVHFNIFHILAMSRNEVNICRVLYELLSLSGSHYQGATYLKLFFDHVLNLDICENELKTAKVYREYLTTEKRRIDLVIETNSKFIAIEVKIDAGEQDNQLKDYYIEAKKHQEKPVVYYLTKKGDTANSADGLTENEIINISFSEQILNWLDFCLKEECTIKIAPIREIILQFINAIRSFTGKMDNEKEREIMNLLASSPENMRSAVEIASAVKIAQIEFMKKFFKKIEEKVGVDRCKTEWDYDYKDFKHLKDMLFKNTYTYPSLNYAFKSKLKADDDILVSFDISDKPTVGYFFPKYLDDKLPFTIDEVRNILGIEPKLDGAYAYSEVVPNEIDSPDFKDFNEAYYDLFDESNFEKLTDLCARKILSLLREKN